MYTSRMDTGTKKDMKKLEDDFIEGNYSLPDAVTPQLETQSTLPPPQVETEFTHSPPQTETQSTLPHPQMETQSTLQPPMMEMQSTLHKEEKENDHGGITPS